MYVPLWLSNHNLASGCSPYASWVVGRMRGGADILLADNLSDRLHETGRGRKEMTDAAAEKHQEYVRNEKDDAHGPLPA